MLRTFWFMLAGMLAAGFSQVVRGADGGWLDQPYPYTVVDQDVRMALRQFGSNLAIPVVIDDEVRGRVKRTDAVRTARQFLDAVALAQGLEWYFDGRVLHVSAAGAAGMQVLQLNGVRFEDLQDNLDSLGIADPRFPLRHEPGADFALISGPPAYVALVEQALASMTAEGAANMSVVHGRRLRDGDG